MLTMFDILRRFTSLNTDEIISQALENTKENLAEINRERMVDGMKADGTEMPHYSYISQTVYGYPDIRITLKDTGAFQEAITIEFTDTTVKTKSVDEKAAKLEARFGSEIYGTYGDYRIEYLEKYLGPEIIRLIKLQLGLKFNRRG